MGSKSGLSYLFIGTIILILCVNCNASFADLIDPCISCLCHTRSGSYSLQACANYSINYSYWLRAGAPKVYPDIPSDVDSYRECMKDDICITDTILKYIETFDDHDCYCDRRFDCRDMLTLHLYGSQCRPIIEKRYEVRYNNCARFKNLQQLDPAIKCTNTDVYD